MQSTNHEGSIRLEETDPDKGVFLVSAIWKKFLIRGTKMRALWRTELPSSIAALPGLPINLQFPQELKTYFLDSLKEPEVTMPPLMKADRNCELKSTCQQYTFEMLFRAQEIKDG